MVEQEAIKIKEVKIKRHPILAGFIDYAFLGYVLGAILALITRIINRPLSDGLLFYFMPFVIVITVSIVYHSVFAKKTLFLSVGERCVGKKIIDGKKVWTNPKGKNRIFDFIFLVIIYTIAMNTWDTISSGNIYSYDQIFVHSGLFTLFVYFTTKDGQKIKMSKKGNNKKSLANS